MNPVLVDTNSSDAELVRSAQIGDSSAFGELVRRHKGRIFAICARFTRSEADLDDLAQDVFVRAWQNLKTYRGDAPLEHWLARIATRLAYDFLRKQKPPALTLEECTLAAPDRDTGHQAREALAWAMARLSPKERLVITLLELQEYSIREVAEFTGWSEANVKVRAHRARQELKQLLVSAGETGKQK